jgi:lysophospholipase
MEIGASPRRSHPAGARFGPWTAPDGRTLRRMDWPQPGGQGRGHLLFAGGRGDFVEKNIEPLIHWHSLGWNVTSFDWRGQGGSRDAAGGLPTASFDPMIDDLASLIADWRGDREGPHVAVGHSMGGHLLLRTLAERHPPVDAAVLVAPMIGVNSAPIPHWLAPDVSDFMCKIGLDARPMWKTPAALLRPGSQRQRFLTSSVERYDDELWWWEQQPGFKVGAPSWSWLRAAFRSAERAFTAEQLGAVETPILLLATDRDRLVSPAAIRRVASLLPHAQLHAYPDAGHEILREADPVRRDALARIDAFFDEHAR